MHCFYILIILLLWLQPSPCLTLVLLVGYRSLPVRRDGQRKAAVEGGGYYIEKYRAAAGTDLYYYMFYFIYPTTLLLCIVYDTLLLSSRLLCRHRGKVRGVVEKSKGSIEIEIKLKKYNNIKGRLEGLIFARKQS